MARRKSKFFDDGGKTDQEKRSEQLDKSAKTNTTTGATKKPSMFNVSPEGAAVGIATGLAGYGLYKGVQAGVKAIKEYRAPYQDAINARKKERRLDRNTNRQERLALRKEAGDMKASGKTSTEIAAMKKAKRAEMKEKRRERRQQRQKTFFDSKQEQLTQNLGKGGKLGNTEGLTDRQIDTLKKHSEHHSAKHMKAMISDMKSGATFSSSHKKAQKKVGAGDGMKMSKSDANFKASFGAILQQVGPAVAKIGAGAIQAMNKDDKKAMNGFKASINSMPSGYNKNK